MVGAIGALTTDKGAGRGNLEASVWALALMQYVIRRLSRPDAVDLLVDETALGTEEPRAKAVALRSRIRSLTDELMTMMRTLPNSRPLPAGSRPGWLTSRRRWRTRGGRASWWTS